MSKVMDFREILEAHAVLYASRAALFVDISQHEDPQGMLRDYLLSHFDFNGKAVLEAGAGGGRITDYYVDSVKKAVLTDIHASMVNILQKKYAGIDSVTAVVCDHSRLHHRFADEFDIFLSAFSFGYAFDPDTEDYDALLDRLLPPAKRHILIEWCGIYEEYDHMRPECIRYVKALEKRFRKEVLHTEFIFSTPEQAYEAAKNLFPAVAEHIKKCGKAVIPDLLCVFHD